MYPEYGFFYDNKLLHGTYFLGLDISIEPRESLISRPPDRVLTMSRTFGRKITGVDLSTDQPIEITRGSA